MTRLSLAWSRDGTEKYYVQDRMREVGAELWRWIAGAPMSMYAAMPSAWRGTSRRPWSTSWLSTARGADDAVAFVPGLKRADRYQADVY